MIAYGILKNQDDAEDAVSEAMASAWQRLEQLRSSALAAAWLYIITRHEAINIYRKNRARSRAARLLMSSGAEDAAGAPAEAIDSSEDRVMIESAMEMLEPSYSEIIRLIFICGKSPGEAAEYLGISPQAAASRLHRARRRFAEIYRQMLENGGDGTKNVL
ncbi:MAG: sigma-70 family RNA polymerase sigma factor [Firmicutes bacterium]|nr:sigma-70 family RNA polymerase sigma factor [Bacillota bacterium]